MLSDLIHSLADQKARDSANQYLHFLNKLKKEVFDRKEVVEVTYIYSITYSITDSHVLHTYRIDRFRIVFGYDRERIAKLFSSHLWLQVQVSFPDTLQMC
jgi:hypothetical protein